MDQESGRREAQSRLRQRGDILGEARSSLPRWHDGDAITISVPRQRPETADQILDLAEMLIQTRGYTAFGYQDIADRLGIRKASIHYHFPSKTNLGAAVVDRYAARFDAALTAIAEDQSQTSWRCWISMPSPISATSRAPTRSACAAHWRARSWCCRPSFAPASTVFSAPTKPG